MRGTDGLSRFPSTAPPRRLCQQCLGQRPAVPHCLSARLCRSAALVARPAAAVTLAAAPDGAGCCTTSSAVADDHDFCLVNFYHLTEVADPAKALEAHRRQLEGSGIRGRIYLSVQGINAQYSGPRAAAVAYAEWVAQQPGFQELRWAADAVSEHQFPRLSLKVRSALVQLAGGTAHLPLTDAQARAQPLSPREWRAMLLAAQAPKTFHDTKSAALACPVNASYSPPPDPVAQQGAPSGAPGVVVLDVRNGYEWDAGHFVGAQRPPEETFNETPAGGGPEALPAALRGVAAETPVMMYCTGGIRCDIYSAHLRAQGFSNLYTLEGGVHNYLRASGDTGAADEATRLWRGSLFVFDARMAVPSGGRGPLAAAIPCQLCGAAAQLPHMNCANIDCNRLFVACDTCKVAHGGCCSSACQTEAPRLLRPTKMAGQYGTWREAAPVGSPDEGPQSIGAGEAAAGHMAADLQLRLAAGRGEGRLIRRRRLAAALRKKHAVARSQRAQRKQAARDAMEARARAAADCETQACNAAHAQDLKQRLLQLQLRRLRVQQRCESGCVTSSSR